MAKCLSCNVFPDIFTGCELTPLYNEGLAAAPAAANPSETHA